MTDDELLSRDVRLREFSLETNDRKLPVAIWSKGDQIGRQPLALVGHGGSQHKLDASVIRIVQDLTERGFIVASIDGPVHGARRVDGGRDREAVKADFRSYWRSDGAGIARMVEDWRATLDKLLLELGPRPVVYYGASMGTAYGIPFAASDWRITSAAFGMWGFGYPNTEQMRPYVEKVNCPLLFVVKLEDELFNRAGTLEMLDLLPSTAKRIYAFPGGHVELDKQQRDLVIQYLQSSIAGQML